MKSRRYVPFIAVIAVAAVAVGVGAAVRSAKATSGPAKSAAVAVQAPTADNSATSVDWNGYYQGTIPGADCAGIATWLSLDQFDGKTQYQLTETYLNQTPQTHRSAGIATWNKEGNRLTLDANGDHRVLFISEGWVEFLGKNSQPGSGDSQYTLKKIKTYAGNGEQLLVDNGSVKATKEHGAQIVKFSGVINYEHKMDADQLSLSADFVVDLTKGSYTMPQATAYSQRFATGKVIANAVKNAGAAHTFNGQDDVVRQAAMEAIGK